MKPKKIILPVLFARNDVMVDREARNQLIRYIEALRDRTMPPAEICKVLEHDFENSQDRMVFEMASAIFIDFADEIDDVLHPQVYKFYADYLERWRLALLSDGELIVVKKRRNMFSIFHILIMPSLILALLVLWIGRGIMPTGETTLTFIMMGLWGIGGLLEVFFYSRCRSEEKGNPLEPFQSYSSLRKLARVLRFHKKHCYPYPIPYKEKVVYSLNWLQKILLFFGWPLISFIIFLLWLAGESVYDVKSPAENK